MTTVNKEGLLISQIWTTQVHLQVGFSRAGILESFVEGGTGGRFGMPSVSDWNELIKWSIIVDHSFDSLNRIDFFRDLRTTNKDWWSKLLF